MTSCKNHSSGPGVTCRGSAPMTGPSRNGCSVSRNLLTDADQAARSRPIAVQDQCAEDVRDDTWLDQVLDRQLVSGVLQYLSLAHQTVLAETFYCGGTPATTARQLGIPPGTTRSQLTTRCTPCASSCKSGTRPRSDELPPAGDPPAATTVLTDIRPGRRLIAVMLLAAAALDLTRCGLVLVTARHAGPAAGLVAAGLAAAALSLCSARGCQIGRRWSSWAALLIGAASAPQAAASGFHAPFTATDTATAVLRVLLAVAVLATVGRTGQPFTENPYTTDGRATR
jgi:hypothetical protein